MSMKVAIGADHAGFPLKETIKKVLTDEGCEVSTSAQTQQILWIIQILHWQSEKQFSKGARNAVSFFAEVV